jgi:hypothetical protein
VQYISFLNGTGPPRPPLMIMDYLDALVGSNLSVWALATLAAVVVLYREFGSA